MVKETVTRTTIAGFPAIRTDGDPSRPLLLFLHGAFVSHEPFAPFMLHLAAAGWRSVAAARRGRLGIGPDRANGVTLADYVEDTLKVIDALGETPVIVGHSLGGLLAQRLAEMGRAKGLVLLAPAPAKRLPAQRVALSTFLPMMPKIIAGRPVMPGPNGCTTIALNRIPPEQRPRIHAELIPESGAAYREIIFGTFKVDASKVRCPVLVMVGSDDRIVAPSLAHWTAKRYGGEFREYPEHAHWLLEEPGWEEIAADMTGWLDAKFPTVRLARSA